jgi:putative RecB family exonuclease
MRERFSYSRLQTYESCPQKFQFAYVQKLKVPLEGIEAFMGSRIHEALERLYKNVLMGKILTSGELLDFYGRRWEAAWHGDVQVVKSDFSPSDYRLQGEKALSLYHSRYHPFDLGQSMGLELKIDFNLDDEGLFPFTGIIDRLTRIDEGLWEIHDYKTTGTLPTQPDLDGDEQLAIYQAALEKFYPQARDFELVWHFLTFDTEMRSKRTGTELAELRRTFIDRIKTIEAQREYPTKVGPLCGWCSYKALCPAWKHDATLAALTREERERDEGLVLVDRYMEVKRRLDALEGEEEELRSKIISYAKDVGISTLTGSRERIRVWPYSKACIPDYDDPRREELGNLLKSQGLWDSCSTLSQVELSRTIERGQIPPPDLAAIERYIIRKESAKLYPRKK